MAGEMMSTWIVAFYDYAEQILKAQRQFTDSVLGAGGAMLMFGATTLPQQRHVGRHLGHHPDRAREHYRRIH